MAQELFVQVRRYAIVLVWITSFVVYGPLVSQWLGHLYHDAKVSDLRNVPGGICFEYEDGSLVAYDCPSTDMTTPDPLVRRLLGLPICWWSASADELQRISGVGARTAPGLARYRDVGGLPTVEQLDTIHRIGESTATKIANAVTVDCRMIGD